MDKENEVTLLKLVSREKKINWKMQVIGWLGIISLLLASCGPVQREPIKDGQITRSVLTKTDPGFVEDLSVIIEIKHEYVGDLKIDLMHAGRIVNIVDVLMCDEEDIVVIFSDHAQRSLALDDICSKPPFPGVNGLIMPAEPLNKFDGMPIAGDWILFISDESQGARGSLTSWNIIP